MAARHGKNVIRLFHQRLRERLAAEAGEIRAQRTQGGEGVGTRGETGGGADSSGGHLDVLAVPGHFSEQSFRHGAAADISGANEKNVSNGFHEVGFGAGSGLKE